MQYMHRYLLKLACAEIGSCSPILNPVGGGETAEQLLAPLQDVVVGVLERVGVDTERANRNRVQSEALVHPLHRDDRVLLSLLLDVLDQVVNDLLHRLQH